MKGSTLLVAMLFLGSVVWANGRNTQPPPTTTPAPPRTEAPAPPTATLPEATTPTPAPPVAAAPAPTAPGTTCPPAVGMIQSTGVASANLSPVCPISSVSPETACLLNEIAALRTEVRAERADIRATALEMRGQALSERLNQLMANELMFRQIVASNPNTTSAQLQAMQIQSQADTLYRDIAAYNAELGTIPTDLRPYMATRINTFQQVYWNPSMQQFAAYRSQFPQSASTYQNAYASAPWLQTWYSRYQTSINNIASVPQTYASANWWSNMQVAGTMETYPGATPSTMTASTTMTTAPMATGTTTMPSGTMMTAPSGMNLPTGAVIFIPAGSIMNINTAPMGTTGTTGAAGAAGTPNTGAAGAGATLTPGY